MVSSDPYDRSRIATVVCAVITSNLRLADAPGNVLLDEAAGLTRASVVDASQVITLDKGDLTDFAGTLDADTMRLIDAGLLRVLGL